MSYINLFLGTRLNLTLCLFSGSLSIGNTGIPFKIRLPQTIPGNSVSPSPKKGHGKVSRKRAL